MDATDKHFQKTSQLQKLILECKEGDSEHIVYQIKATISQMFQFKQFAKSHSTQVAVMKTSRQDKQCTFSKTGQIQQFIPAVIQ